MSTSFYSKTAPFIKWPGGKTAELEGIKDASPKSIKGRYIEPFLGGGAVYMSIDQSIPARVNDSCTELINLYIHSSEQNKDFQLILKFIAKEWESLSVVRESIKGIIGSEIINSNFDSIKIVKLINKKILTLDFKLSTNFKSNFLKKISLDLPKKINRMLIIQARKNKNLTHSDILDNIEGSVRSSYYMMLRNIYNQLRISNTENYVRDATFFFIREFCYASMFRFNSKNEFNVPYGGISYNNKNFLEKVEKLYNPKLLSRFQNTKFYKFDFQHFLSVVDPKPDDFIFVDPPYDSDFNKYDNNSFEHFDQVRLVKTLQEIDSKIMIVIGSTPFVEKLYSSDHWNLQKKSLNYRWNIKSRYDQSANHLTVTNF